MMLVFPRLGPESRFMKRNLRLFFLSNPDRDNNITKTVHTHTVNTLEEEEESGHEYNQGSVMMKRFRVKRLNTSHALSSQSELNQNFKKSELN